VRDGIVLHTGPREPEALEAKIVRLVDRVAYINHDIDDAIRFGILAADELPAAEVKLLGPTGARRIDTLVHDLIETSEATGDIAQSEQVGAAMLSLRSFMFERVYLGPHTQDQHRQASAVVRKIFAHFAERGDDRQEIVDYLSGMTDRFALSYAEQL
jgi:dGTPase